MKTSTLLAPLLVALTVGCGLTADGTAPDDASVDVTTDLGLPPDGNPLPDRVEPPDAPDARAADATTEAGDAPDGDAGDTGDSMIAMDAADADADDALAADADDTGVDSAPDANETSVAEAGEDAPPDAEDAGPLFTIGGNLSGLTSGDTLLLFDDGGDEIFPTANGPFMFSLGLRAGASYSVTVAGQPIGETCTVTAGSGIVGSSDVTSVAVTCVANTATVGGSVTGYQGSGLQLGDGTGGPITVAMGATSFAFPGLNAGATYAVTIVAQPTGPAESCSVTAGGSGTVATTNVTNVQVTCVATPACAPTCTPGATCGASTDCLTKVCAGGMCQKGEPQAPCANNGNNCLSGTCTGSSDTCAQGGVSTPCVAAFDCLSGVCTNGSCAKGGPTTPCANNGNNCLSGTCTGSSDTCAQGGVSTPCVAAFDCLSGVCANGSCAKGGAGTSCANNGNNCLSGVCTGDMCGLGNDGAACNAGSDCGSAVCSGPGGTCQPPACASANPRCGAGSACGSGSDCKNNQCNDFVCK